MAFTKSYSKEYEDGYIKITRNVFKIEQYLAHNFQDGYVVSISIRDDISWCFDIEEARRQFDLFINRLVLWLRKRHPEFELKYLVGIELIRGSSIQFNMVSNLTPNICNSSHLHSIWGNGCVSGKRRLPFLDSARRKLSKSFWDLRLIHNVTQLFWKSKNVTLPSKVKPSKDAQERSTAANKPGGHSSQLVHRGWDVPGLKTKGGA